MSLALSFCDWNLELGRPIFALFFSVQCLIAFARSFSTLDSMLHISELFN